MWVSFLLALSVLALVQFWFLVHVWYWNDHNPDETAFMHARLERLRDKEPRVILKHEWVPYKRIASSLKRAVIAAEDAKFLDHEGFDWDGIQKAYEKNVKKGKIVSGGSTISQQLANEPGGSLESGRYTRLIRPLVHAFLLQYGAKPGRKRPSSR